VEPEDKLSKEEIMSLPQRERGKFIESSVLSLIIANSKRGLTLAEIERITQYSKHTLYKHIELLYAKRKINKISRGGYSIYHSTGQIYYNNNFKDIMYGNDKRFSVQLLENIEGKNILIQEKELDENGFVNDIGGILIPIQIIPDLINMLYHLKESLQTMSKDNNKK
jgi:hypothetical protein